MLSDKLVNECSMLNRLQFQDFVKTINYSINLILNPQNQMKINQFIEISQQNGQKLTQITLSLINALTTFNVNVNLLQQKIKLLRFQKQKTEFLKQKMNDNLYQLRKIIYSKDLADITTIQKIDWRFQVEVASKTCKNTFNPNILMHLKLKNNFQSVKFSFKKVKQKCSFQHGFRESQKFTISTQSSTQNSQKSQIQSCKKQQCMICSFFSFV